LPLGAGLAEALHEWAKVADAVSRTDSPSEGVAEALVTRRGRQLAGRLAADMGSPVRYTDPVTGDVVTVDVPAAEDEPRPDESRPGEARPDGPDDADAAEAGQAPE
ncbi:hypothetical protein K7G98_38185, partial [Saccharothrix sp. MB29]|nr:hypothetical protein [Saccharothrix sp. MB29]